MGLIDRVRTLRRQVRYLRTNRRPASRRSAGPERLQDFIPWCSRRTSAGAPVHTSPRHLSPLTELLERAEREQVEVCFSVPPRHGKSTTLHYWIAWLLLRDPTKRILYCSYDQTFAEKQVAKAKRIALRAGVAIGDRDTQAEWTTAEGGCVRACGIASPPLGEGFHIVIVDDPHKNRAEAESKKIRDRVVEAFLDDIYTRQEPGGVGTTFVIVHTRWHEDDLIGSLSRASEDGEVGGFEYVNLPATSTLPSGERVALAPWLWTLKQLEKWEKRLGLYGWVSLFMGEPRPRGDRVFIDAFLCDLVDVPTVGVDYLGVDLAHTAKTRSDPQAAVALRRSSQTDGAGQPIYYVTDVRTKQGPLANKLDASGKVEVEGFASELYWMQRALGGCPAGIYCATNEVNAIELLATLAHTPVFIKPHVTPSKNDKFQRAQAVAAAWREGRIRVPRDAPWASAFIAQLVAFTGKDGERDDLVDALAVAYDMLAGGDGLTVQSPAPDPERRPMRSMRQKRWT